jgi:hypothetical protein
MKLTRPPAGSLLILVIVVFVLTAGLWAASYMVAGETPASLVSRMMWRVELANLGIAFIVFFASLIWPGYSLAPSTELDAAIKQNGKLRTLLLPSTWRTVWRIQYPYAPHWMQVLLITAILGIPILWIGSILFGWPIFSGTDGGSMRLGMVLPFMFAAQALPIWYSKWRELSQPAASTSPEVRPS